MQIHIPNVHAAQTDRAARDVIEPGDQVHHRGLAGAGGADDGVHLSGRHREADVGQQGLGRIVGEDRVIVADLSVLQIGLQAVLRAHDGVFHIKVVEDPGEQGK